MPKTAREHSTTFERTLKRIAIERRKKIALSQSEVVDDVTSLVRAFGGAEPLTEWLYIPGSNMSVAKVADWMVTGDIPTGWHMRLYWELTQRGYVVDPVALGWVRGPQKKRPATRKKRAH